MSDDKDMKRKRYAEDPAYREKTLAANRKRYAENEEFREGTLAAKRQRTRIPSIEKARSRRHHQDNRSRTRGQAVAPPAVGRL